MNRRTVNQFKTTTHKELDKDVLVASVLVDDLIVLLRDKVPNVLSLSGDRSGLDVWLDLSLLELLDKLSDGLGVPGDGSSLERVLGLSRKVLNGESWPRVSREVERLGVVDELDGVDPDERDLALVLGSDRLDGLDEGLVGELFRRVDEGVSDWDSGGGVGSKVLG